MLAWDRSASRSRPEQNGIASLSRTQQDGRYYHRSKHARERLAAILARTGATAGGAHRLREREALREAERERLLLRLRERLRLSLDAERPLPARAVSHRGACELRPAHSWLKTLKQAPLER
jgi:hypothetical protein